MLYYFKKIEKKKSKNSQNKQKFEKRLIISEKYEVSTIN